MSSVQILMYHQVGDFEPMKTHRATYCDYRRFARQMAWLKYGGYSVVSLEQARAGLAGETTLPSRAVVLTFDDAYENFYEYAFPVLHKYGFPATIYAIGSMLGKRADWLLADGHEAPPLMSSSRLRELIAAGMEVGSHSFTHIRLAECDADRIRDEVTRSKAVLEDMLGEAVTHFCYPYGSHDLRVVEAAADAGYLTGTTCERAQATTEDDPLTLPRKAVAWGDSLVGVMWKMHMKNKPKRPLLRRPQFDVLIGR